MAYGFLMILLGLLSFFKLIKYPTKEEDEILYNDIGIWGLAICGIFFGLAIIIKELLK